MGLETVVASAGPSSLFTLSRNTKVLGAVFRASGDPENASRLTGNGSVWWLLPRMAMCFQGV
jgi:hypothetical protein